MKKIIGSFLILTTSLLADTYMGPIFDVKNGPKRLHELVENLENKIPNELREAIGEAIPVELKSGPSVEIPNCISQEARNISQKQKLPQLAHNSFSRVWGKNKILLNYNVLPHIQISKKKSQKYPCLHKNIYDETRGALINQIAKFYYKKVFKSKKEHLKFLELANFEKTGAFFPSRGVTNYDYRRTPNPQEFNSAEDAFAVHFEYFLLDPEYMCRRPSLGKFFKNYFSGYDPHPNRKCKVPTLIKLSETDLDSFEDQEVSLDLERVYEVHSLTAGAGDHLSTSRGHSMLKIVMCAPGRPRGPDCLKDEEHHLALSFTIFQDDLETSTLKGIFGGYYATNFILPMSDVNRVYLLDDKRDLESIPIPMSRIEIERMVDRILEVRSLYKGAYYFTANNCSIGARSMVESVMELDHPIHNQYHPQPFGVQAILSAGISKDATRGEKYLTLKEKEVALRNYRKLKFLSRDVPETFEEFGQYTIEQRTKTYDFLLKNKKIEAIKLAKEIEQYYHDELFRQIRMDTKEVFLASRGNCPQGCLEAQAQGREFLEKLLAVKKKRFLEPPGLVSGYGVPLPKDYSNQADRDKEVLNEILKLVKGIQSLYPVIFREKMAELLELKQLLNKLH